MPTYVTMSDLRRSRREEQDRELASPTVSRIYRRRVRRMGEERSVDFDVVLAISSELQHGVDRRRYVQTRQRGPEWSRLDEKLIAARAALRDLVGAYSAVYWLADEEE